MRKLTLLIILLTPLILFPKELTASEPVSPTSVLNTPEVVVKAFDESTSSALKQNKELKTIVSKISLLVFRLNSINNKINTRITKLQKNKIKTTKLNPKLNFLSKSFDALNKQMTLVLSLEEKINKSKNPQSEYEEFNREVANIKKMMRDILSSQNTIVVDLKGIGPVVTASLTKEPTPMVKR